MNNSMASNIHWHTRCICWLWVAIIVLCVWSYRTVTELRIQMAEDSAVVRHMKQPLTVHVYPQVVQKYDGLPGFKGFK